MCVCVCVCVLRIMINKFNLWCAFVKQHKQTQQATKVRRKINGKIHKMMNEI